MSLTSKLLDFGESNVDRADPSWADGSAHPSTADPHESQNRRASGFGHPPVWVMWLQISSGLGDGSRLILGFDWGERGLFVTRAPRKEEI